MSDSNVKLRKHLNGRPPSNRIYTPTECLVPAVEDGYIIVHPKKESSVYILKRKGFEVVGLSKSDVPKKVVKVNADSKPSAVAKKPSKTPKPLLTTGSLKLLTVKELIKIAREMKIVGRSTMREDELIDAIIKNGESK